MRMLVAVCLLVLPVLPSVASDRNRPAHCSREAGVRLSKLQAYFAAHRALEVEFGL